MAIKSIAQFCKYLLWTLLAGIFIGSASAFFLFLLDWSTQTREANSCLIYFLPLSGLLIVFLYQKIDSNSLKGNNLLITSYQDAKGPISWKMAPLIFVATIITHLFGGSAGREGTAIQMGGSLSWQLSVFFKLSESEKRLCILIGVAAGFASVFGTPWAGFIFAFEFLWAKEKTASHFFLVLLAAFLAHYTCLFWEISHTAFKPVLFPQISTSLFINIALAGLIFGLTGRFFVYFQAKVSSFFLLFKSEYLRVFAGGLMVLVLVQTFHLNDFVGLGVPAILSSFEQAHGLHFFLVKILLTVITLSSGYKGGEVTPLFFIGASLGSALVWVFPVPVSLLAALGLLAVFSAAAQVPITAIIMGAELFGVNGFPFYVLVCLFAFFTAGNHGIYSEHPMKNSKPKWFQKLLNAHRNFHK